MATVAGLFPDRGSAENAINALQTAGFESSRIGVVMRDRRETQELTDEAGLNSTAGAVAGGAIGGTLGAILAATGALVIPGIGPFVSGGILATALVGGVAGWLVGGLVALGIPREDAEYYQGQVEQGHVLVTVDAAGRENEARMVLMESGAEDVRGRGEAAADTNPAVTTGDPYQPYQGVAAANQPLDAATAPVANQPANNPPIQGQPADTYYDTSAVNPSGTPTQPLPNEQAYAAQRSDVPAEGDTSDAPRSNVILPPGFVANARAAQSYGVADAPTQPLAGSQSGVAGSAAPATDNSVQSPDANSGVVGSSAPTANDAVPMVGQAMPRPDDAAAVNPNGTQDATDDAAGVIRDDDIIRQEQQRME